MNMTASVKYRRMAQCGNDWNYLSLEPAVFVFELPHAAIPKGFVNAWLAIAPTYDAGGKETITCTVAPYYAWDGPSVVPDVAGTIEASLIHDALYQFAEEIAKAWGWSVKAVLALADNMFKWSMQFYKVPEVVWKTYYAGVAVFGWFFHVGAILFKKIKGS